MTWGEVAEVYSKLTGVKIRWCGEEEYLDFDKEVASKKWNWKYDRRFNRDVDCSKVLKATGLTSADFASIEEGIRHELKKLGYDC